MIFPFLKNRTKEFDEDLKDLGKLVYTDGAWRGSRKIRTYTFADGKVKRVTEHHIGAKDEGTSVSFPYIKDEFLEGLREFKIGAWKETYNDPRARDGWFWELKFEYAGEKNHRIFSGSNACPKNYKEVKAFLEKE